MTNELAKGVKDITVAENSEAQGKLELSVSGKDRVSFGTNMTIEEDTSGSVSKGEEESKQLTAIERFHARKFGPKTVSSKGALKIAGTGREIEKPKKIKALLAPGIQEAVQALIGQGKEYSEAVAAVKMEAEEDNEVAEMEVAVAKKRKADTTQAVTTNLTGAHGEPHQEK